MSPDKESRAPAEKAPMTGHEKAEEFFKRRRRLNLWLLLFVIIVGSPIGAVPKLRDRFLTRVFTLKDAMAGNIKPAVAQVGVNHEPLPPEFELPRTPALPLPQSEPPAKMYVMSRDGKITARKPSKMTKLEVVPPASGQGEETTEQGAVAPEAAADNEPKYQQGKAEQAAYDLLLKSNATVAGIVNGSNVSLHFKTWDAASRGDDIYWVRLKIQAAANRIDDYIWQVKLQANQVTPLNFNARSLP